VRCLSVVRLAYEQGSVWLHCPTCQYAEELGPDVPIDTALEAESNHDEREIEQ